jgi:hypothetical protein
VSNPDALPMTVAGPGDQLFAYTAVLGRRTVTPHVRAGRRGRGRRERGGSQTQYLVQYAGTDPEGRPWPPKWEPAGNLVGGDPDADLDIALFPGTLNSTRRLVGREVAVLNIDYDNPHHIDQAAPCQLCGSPDYTWDDELVECTRCGALVHQNCNKPVLDKVPDGAWWCAGCSYGGLDTPPAKPQRPRLAGTLWANLNPDYAKYPYVIKFEDTAQLPMYTDMAGNNVWHGGQEDSQRGIRIRNEVNLVEPPATPRLCTQRRTRPRQAGGNSEGSRWTG